MFGLVKALGVVKGAAAVTVLTAVVAAGAVQATLPSQSANGQAHATAGAANGQSSQNNGPSTQGDTQKPDTQAVTDQLAANQQRLLANLNAVLQRLTDAGANQHAIDALTKVIDKLTNDDIGLNRAQEAVSNQGGGPPAPVPASSAGTDHPTSTNHPGRP
jgi:hypothetical protein